MQTLYTSDSMGMNANVAEAKKLLRKQFEQTRQLFLYLTYFITETARYAETDSARKAGKHLPTEADLNINIKVAGNDLLWKILEEPSFKAACADIKPQHIIDQALLKKTYEALAASEEYKDYITVLSREKKSEKDILQFIFTDLMLPNEDFISHVEEHFINWDDDAEMVNVLMQNCLQKPQHFNFLEMVSPDKMEFALSLLETVIEKKEVSMELLKPKLKNWDEERIASLDLIII